MLELELAQDKLGLIEKIIKSNSKYINNEDLYDDFFNETCKRSLLIVKTVSSEDTLEAYLRKIATTSILNVLKNSGRLRRGKSGYMSSGEVSLDKIADDTQDYSSAKITYSSVNIPETPENFAIKKDILEKIVDTVIEINSEEPDEKYLELFILRFQKGMTQKEIAAKTGISQSETSKRLFKLMEKVKEAFN